ncbi:N-succinylarginine dihydrolase [Escherichia coli]
MNAREVNFDGLVGLTHHYAGLSFGNEASTRHRFQVSNPRLAAKQGLTENESPCRCGIPQSRDPAARASVYSGAASVGIQR